MNETLMAVMDMVRAVARATQMKTKRNYTDFLSDRIIQATSKTTLLDAVERLACLVDAAPGGVFEKTFTDFIKSCGNPDAPAALAWLRKYPVIASMLAALPLDDYYATVDAIDLPDCKAESGTAISSAQYEIPITVTCLSPLAHGADTKAGNATLFRRMQILSDTGSVLSLPYYAGNALRGQIRDLLADDLVKALGLTPRRDKPPIALWFFHALYAGGALEENSEAAKKLNKELGGNGSVKASGIHKFRDTLPGLSVLGCALGNRILCGRIKVADLKPSCRQWANGDIDASELFEWLYLTRREDHEEHEDHSGMIANTECLRSGTVLFGGIDFDVHANELERSALVHGLKLLAERGYLGADNRRGFGSVKIECAMPDPGIYEKYLAENKALIFEYLIDLGAIDAELVE